MALPTHEIINSDAPGEFAVAVTPSDSTMIAQVPRALYIGTGGNVSVRMPRGNTVTFTSVPGGTILPVRVSRVNATGTTASNIVAIG